MAENLVMNEKFSDVTLKVRHGGYSWRFPAHSLMLHSQSAPLRQLLEERSEDSHPSPVTILGMEPDTTLALLRYIYSGTVPTKISANLLVAAEKYGLDALRDKLEEKLLPDLTIAQACHMLEDFEDEQPMNDDCVLKTACLDVLEKHAYTVFSSDLLLCLSKRILQRLLESDKLNVPDESVVFWGVWRWGFYHSARNNRTLEDGNIAAYLDELLTLIRVCSLRYRRDIPEIALRRFNRCAGRRCRYLPPDDTLYQSCTLRTCGTWESISDILGGDEGDLCLQISFDKDVMIVGLTMEVISTISSNSRIEGYLRIFQESNGKELLRQELNCGRCLPRKLSRTGEPESWIESDIVFSEPLILPRSEICSIYLQMSGTPWALPRVPARPRRKRVESTFAEFHGQSVFAVRELHLLPDVTVTWGIRR